ncbi:MAG: hypothetical protein JWQ81_2695 [Amycolatopsis sp.]|uniref:hypothetical protein n=1 Tax=Amycolatopsis sp. TaxID=37632 RepID=UPI00263A2891|nr:hypothetical protein [Amycolatopsis sp.]MCU1681956.1 hypothetical protein [Amycolatopsis sp.]
MTDSGHLRALADLSDREEELVEAARRGEELKCSDLGVGDLACSELAEHQIRAELIRELALGRRGELDPRGVKLRGAHIVGILDLDFVHAIAGLSFAECVIIDPITAKAASLPQFTLTQSSINRVDASNATISGSLIFNKLRMRISTEGGAICLVGAHIAGDLDLRNADITNDAGPILHAGRLQVDGNVELGGLQAAGSCEQGSIRLISARIGGYLSGKDAKIDNDMGPSIFADRLKIDGGVSLSGLHASGVGDRGTIRLNGARIGGQLTFLRAKVLHGDGGGSNFDFDSTRVERAVFFPAELICPEAYGMKSCPNSGKIDLDGFTFSSLRRVEWKQWLHLIRFHKPNYLASPYRPWPYQQLAAVERAAGHDSHARQILICQQHDLRVHAPEAVGGRVTLLFHWMWGALAGYGYRARRIAVALLFALATSGALGYAAGQFSVRPGHYAAERTGTASGSVGAACSSVELIGLGLDRGLPLAPTGLRASCDLDTTTRWGQIFTIAIWLDQFTIWGLATLALAGYTSLIRKSG